MVHDVALNTLKIFPSRTVGKEIQLQRKSCGCGCHLAYHGKHLVVHAVVMGQKMFQRVAQQLHIDA